MKQLSSNTRWYKNPFHKVFAGIVCVYLILAAVYFMGLCQSDDFSYVGYAWNVGTERFAMNMDMDFRALRFPMILPTAFFIRILGIGEVQAVLTPILYTLGTMIIIYFLGTMTGGAWTGLFSTALFIFVPGTLIYSTSLVPDMIVPFWIALSALLFLYARKENRVPESFILYAGTGIALSMAFFTRVNSFYFFLFFLPYLFVRKELRKGSYCIFLGFGVPIILVYIFYMIKTGDFLFNVHLIRARAEQLMSSGYISRNDPFQIFRYAMPFFSSVKWHLQNQANPIRFSSSEFGITFYLAVTAAIYSLVVYMKKREVRYILWWFVVLYAFIEYGTVSFSDYQMMKKLPRFLTTLLPAASILMGISVAQLLGLFNTKSFKPGRLIPRESLKIIVWAVMVVFITHSLWAAHTLKVTISKNMDKFRWGYKEVLKNEPVEKAVISGGWWANKLGTYFLPKEGFFFFPGGLPASNIIQVTDIKDISELDGCHVIIDDSHFTGFNDLRVNLSYDDLIPELCLPPENWKLMGDAHSVQIYSVPHGQVSEKRKLTKEEKQQRAIAVFKRALSHGQLPGLFSSILSKNFLKKYGKRGAIGLYYHFIQRKNSPEIKQLMNSMRLVEENGKLKIDFNIKMN